MNNRYKILQKSITTSLSYGAPAMVQAFALLEDIKSGNRIAQVKFRSLNNNLVALSVSINGWNVWNEKTIDEHEFRYAEIETKRDDMFGDRVAIALPTRDVNKIDVTITRAVLSSGELWEKGDSIAEIVPKQTDLLSALDNIWNVAEYRKTFGDNALYKPLIAKGIWFCTCGASNCESEEKCHSCHNDLNEMTRLCHPEKMYNQRRYKTALLKIEIGSEKSLSEALNILSLLEDCENSEILLKECKERLSDLQIKAMIEEQKEENKAKDAKLEEARNLITSKKKNNLESAIVILSEIPGWKDSDELKQSAEYIVSGKAEEDKRLTEENKKAEKKATRVAQLETKKRERTAIVESKQSIEISADEKELCKKTEAENVVENSKMALDVNPHTKYEDTDALVDNDSAISKNKSEFVDRRKTLMKYMVIAIIALLCVRILTSYAIENGYVKYISCSIEDDPYAKYECYESIDVFDSKKKADQLFAPYCSFLYDNEEYGKLIDVVNSLNWQYNPHSVDIVFYDFDFEDVNLEKMYWESAFHFTYDTLKNLYSGPKPVVYFKTPRVASNLANTIEHVGEHVDEERMVELKYLLIACVMESDKLSHDYDGVLSSFVQELIDRDYKDSKELFKETIQVSLKLVDSGSGDVFERYSIQLHAVGIGTDREMSIKTIYGNDIELRRYGVEGYGNGEYRTWGENGVRLTITSGKPLLLEGVPSSIPVDFFGVSDFLGVTSIRAQLIDESGQILASDSIAINR